MSARAAAIYLLLKSEKHRELALKLLSPSTPPLVLALAEIATDGALGMDQRQVLEAREYLEEDERALPEDHD